MQSRSFLIIATILALAIILYAQQNSPKPLSPIQRYQMFAAQVNLIGNPDGERDIFILDTQTGQAWKYQPLQAVTDKDGSHKVLPELFYPVEMKLNALSKQK